MYNDLYGYSTYDAESLVDATIGSTAMTGAFLGIMIFSLILSLISIISYWKIFNKAGKPGWAALVPVYNSIVMIEVAKLPIWYIVLFFVPIANIYAIFKINIEMAKRFGKSSGFGVGMALLSIIFVPLLAFSDNLYEDDNTVNTNTNNNNTFDATNIINSESSQNVNINTINQFNTIEESIPVESNNVVDQPIVSEQPMVNLNPSNDAMVNETKEPVNITPEAPAPLDNAFNGIPTEVNNVETVEQPNDENVNINNQSVENVNPVYDTIVNVTSEPMNIIPEVPATFDSTINGIPTEVNNVVETVGQPTDENVNINNQPVENVNLVNDSIVNATSEPINITPEAPAPLDNVVNDISTIEPANNNMENEPVNNVQNAFNSTPIMMESIDNTITENLNNNIVENLNNQDNVLSNPTVEEIPLMNNSAIPENFDSLEQKKVCKNCGIELPNIVSICPNCGTDNE